MKDQVYDVAVLGGGNAGLCAALTAREAGASVIVVESAPRDFRGGNSRHTRNLRSAHAAPTDVLTGAYPEDEFLADLLRVTGNDTNEALARLVVSQSAECPGWMRRHGARFQSSLRGTLHLGRTNAFFLGGGKALMNSYYAAAGRLGIDVVYDAEVVGLDLVDGRFEAARVRVGGGTRDVRARAAVLAAGGFESNLEWLREAWGDAADNFIIRGTPYNKGTLLRLMLDAGAQPVGDPRACHAVAVDARAPKFDGGIVTRLDCVSLGIAVNNRCERFYDEGEDFWPKRYAIWGGLIARQPDQIAFSIVDAKAIGKFMPSVFPPIVAPSIGELARCSICTRTGWKRPWPPTTRRCARARSTMRCSTTAGPRDWILPSPTGRSRSTRRRSGDIRCVPGITFTYLGVKVDERARVLMATAQPAGNIYAAGEIMAGNILGRGYIAGVGMTIGTVIGRIAGGEAARHAAH